MIYLSVVMNEKYVFVFFLLLTFQACAVKPTHSVQERSALLEWIEQEKKLQEFYAYVDKNTDCDSIEAFADKITISDMKVKTFNPLSRCFLGKDNEKAKDYLLRNVALGFHPKRIDKEVYKDILNELNDTILMLHNAYWAKKDTVYFSELERRTTLDQTVRKQAMTDPNDEIHRKLDSIDNENQRFLYGICEKYGFPPNYEPSKFSTFRSKVRGNIIATHAPDKDKLNFLEYAIKGARSGKIGWDIPKYIAIEFLGSGISRKGKKGIYPLWLVELANQKSDDEYYFLQLIGIKEWFNSPQQSMHIEIRPSKFNKSSEKIINKQLEKIKSDLVRKFDFDESLIQINSQPIPEEKDYREIADYQYILINKDL